MRYFLTSIFLIFTIVLSFSQVKPTELPFAKVFEDFVKHEDFKNASIGLIAMDFENGEILGNYNSHLSLTPASILKIVTTATALEILGAKTQFKTSLYYKGEIDSNKVLHGDLIIIGGGDPALGSEIFDKIYNKPYFFSTWADSIKKLGIDSIDGFIIGDDSYFNNIDVPSTWIWGDMGNYYGAFASGLSIFENTYKIKFEPEDSTGANAKISEIVPKINSLIIENEVTISDTNKDLAYIYGAPYQNERKIEGTIPKHKNEFIVKGSIPNPAEVALNEIKSELNKINVICNKGTKIEKIITDSLLHFITEIKSPTVEEIVKITNLRSHNLFAEHLALQVGKARNKNLNYNIAVNTIVEFWKSKNIETSGMSLYDGSGLSRYNIITPKQMADVLFYMKNSKNYSSFYSSLPTAGESGTLSGMWKNSIAKGRVNAKSGYITRVRNYAGYMTSISGKKIIFVVMLNNFNCSAADSKNHVEKLFDKMVTVPIH